MAIQKVSFTSLLHGQKILLTYVKVCFKMFLFRLFAPENYLPYRFNKLSPFTHAPKGHFQEIFYRRMSASPNSNSALSDAFWHFIIVMEYREFRADQIFLFHNVTEKKSPDPASLHIFYFFKQRKLKKVAEQIVAYHLISLKK